tara:strand:- start:68 stop:427 length:360 start_codon:yes stop_codon:yes gene_type:complete
MKPLTAYNILPNKKQELFDINNLFDLPNRQDDNYKQYLAIIMKDMDKNGMSNPILVIRKENYWNRLPWTGTDTQLGVITGSNRYRYALERGYTHIEGVICKDKSDWFQMWQSTYQRVDK